MLLSPLRSDHRLADRGLTPFRQMLIWTLVLLLGLAGITTAPATAQRDLRVQTQLISETPAIQPGAPFWVGLRMQIQQGWHTYWQNPGDSGAPTRIQWNLPEGFTAGEILWPYPRRMPVDPLVNFGYEEEVVLLVQITPPGQIQADQITLKARADWLVCQQECLPEEKRLFLTLPVILGDAAPDPRWSDTFQNTRRDLPIPSAWPATAVVEDETVQLDLAWPEGVAGSGQPVQEVAFFPYEDGVIVNAAEQDWQISSQGLSLEMQRGYLPQIDSVSGVLVIREQLEEGTGVQALQIEAEVKPAAAITPTVEIPTAAEIEANASPLPLPQLLVLALLGGLILNLMPCVFPILSLKALSVAQKARYRAAEVRRLSLVFAAGIWVSMAALGLALLGFKALGHQLGWGFQLQSPGFVLGLAYLLFAVGLSLAGVFQIGAAWMGVGQGLTADQGYRGEFFTGVLATVMSTPCTAPFMATAVGAALTQPPLASLLILQVLGIGLALPYLILGFVPVAQSLLPKPGAWMEILQQVLAFPVFGTVAWLIWVLAQQSGSTGLALALGGVILVAFGIWVLQKGQGARQPWQRITRILALGSMGIAWGLMLVLPQATPVQLASRAGEPETQTGLVWETYSQDRLDQSLQAGEPVFVNFSAAWCVTCLVNDRVALSRPEVVEALETRNITLLKADWTNRDDQITQALRGFGRSGVPLYVMYSGSDRDREPLILPQVLTPKLVLDSLQAIGAR